MLIAKESYYSKNKIPSTSYSFFPPSSFLSDGFNAGASSDPNQSPTAVGSVAITIQMVLASTPTTYRGRALNESVACSIADTTFWCCGDAIFSIKS